MCFEELHDALHCLFEIYWKANADPKNPGEASPKPQPRAQRSSSFSRHYRMDMRGMLVYLFVASRPLPVGTSSAASDELLKKDIEWEGKDDVLIARENLHDLVRTVAELVVTDIAELNPNNPKFVEQKHPRESAIKALVDRILCGNISHGKAIPDEISLRDCYDWFQRHDPFFFNPLDVHLYEIFFGKQDDALRVYRGPLSVLPKLSDPSAILSPEELWLLSSALPHKYLISHHDKSNPERALLHPQWKLLFNTDDQGHSIKQFEYYALDYHAPTVLLILAESKSVPDETIVLASYVSSAWKGLKKEYWGNDETFLMELFPYFEKFSAISGKSSDYVYCHSDKGIGFGGSFKEGFMLSVDTSFQKGLFTTSRSGGFHASQHRSFHHELNVLRVELWGLGSAAVYDRWKKEKVYSAQSAERRQQINMKQDREVDQIILEMVGTHEVHPEERKPIQ